VIGRIRPGFGIAVIRRAPLGTARIAPGHGRQSVQMRENHTQSRRSAAVRRRRGRRERSRTCSWCLSARISRCSASRRCARHATTTLSSGSTRPDAERERMDRRAPMLARASDDLILEGLLPMRVRVVRTCSTKRLPRPGWRAS
jgi:hypothetical protein